VLGRDFYCCLVNRCYGLPRSQALPAKRAAQAPARVVKEVEHHFAALPPTTALFDHDGPAAYLMEHAEDFREPTTVREVALVRFERLFADLNALLGRT